MTRQQISPEDLGIARGTRKIIRDFQSAQAISAIRDADFADMETRSGEGLGFVTALVIAAALAICSVAVLNHFGLL